MLGEAGYTLAVDYNARTLNIAVSLGKKRMRDDVENMVTYEAPANMVITVVLLYNTYDAFTGMTYDQMALKTYTELREEEI